MYSYYTHLNIGLKAPRDHNAHMCMNILFYLFIFRDYSANHMFGPELELKLLNDKKDERRTRLPISSFSFLHYHYNSSSILSSILSTKSKNARSISSLSVLIIALG